MKDRTARILAVIALVFMGLFIVTLIMTLVDHTMINGSIGFFALGAGVFALMILVALKADGRGFSMTKINNEIEMEKIQKEQEKREAEQKAKEESADRDGDGDGENAEEAKSESEEAPDTEDKTRDGEPNDVSADR
ncbi:MAG: cytochrome d ubiquinol oxidase subunit II [Clostridia bacterium]|jgi:hypothetical protein|nr:cytochrome d ubiquinol oxidase subunit II [Clostridia bacterium]MCI9459341.1 cytochrome d ubiquinol oxidase subunit II [Clostridia bacterium]